MAMLVSRYNKEETFEEYYARITAFYEGLTMV